MVSAPSSNNSSENNNYSEINSWIPENNNTEYNSSSSRLEFTNVARSVADSMTQLLQTLRNSVELLPINIHDNNNINDNILINNIDNDFILESRLQEEELTEETTTNDKTQHNQLGR